MAEVQVDIVFVGRMSLAAFLAFIVGWEREPRQRGWGQDTRNGGPGRCRLHKYWDRVVSRDRRKAHRRRSDRRRLLGGWHDHAGRNERSWPDDRSGHLGGLIGRGCGWRWGVRARRPSDRPDPTHPHVGATAIPIAHRRCEAPFANVGGASSRRTIRWLPYAPPFHAKGPSS